MNALAPPSILKDWKYPIALFALLLAHGAALGLSDDEAYYWVLAQKPALGYAYHPPMVAWWIALSTRLFGAAPWSVRLPAALGTALLLRIAQGWSRRESPWLFLSFAGLFALGWMMVPDIPLLLGWTIAFAATWAICFFDHPGRRHYVGLALGLALACLSKYSAVLGALSAAIAIGRWAPRERRRGGLLAIALGGLAAVAPILYWNAEHEWASILYQLRDRHDGFHPSAVRYGRFWAISLLVAGPGLIYHFGRLLVRPQTRRERFAWAWILPGALVFCVQPLGAEFKPHWAFIVWWPVLLAWAAEPSRGRLRLTQTLYGCALGAFALAGCHLPLMGWILRPWPQYARDPRWDVANDLSGWDELPAALAADASVRGWPVVGAVYQTAAQASFAMRDVVPGTLLPRETKSRDEWPDPGVADGLGPGWPRLTHPVLFVADNRYAGGPGFPDAKCEPGPRIEARRFGLVAKTISVWKCRP